MATPEFDLGDIKRRMQGAVSSLSKDLGSLRTGRASGRISIASRYASATGLRSSTSESDATTVACVYEATSARML